MNWEAFFKLYNERLASAYESAINNNLIACEQIDSEFQRGLKNAVLNSMQTWYDIRFKELEDKTPNEMIGTLTDIDSAYKVFLMAGELCDDDIPEYIKIKLGKFGDGAISKLKITALSESWEIYGDGEIPPPASLVNAGIALKLLGEWSAVDTLEAVLSRLENTITPSEIITDAFKSYIIDLGEYCAPALISRLTAACGRESGINVSHEYMMIVLTLIGANTENDDIYSCLRLCFRKMDHKIIGIICLGDYGDPRAVTILKSFLETSASEIDRQSFYEALSSIKRLGGDISDINDPFKDFSIKR